MRKVQNFKQHVSEVDMTPMLDIVFIMLIFFIVTTSFTKEYGLTINQQKQSETVQQPKVEHIFINIDRDNMLSIRTGETSRTITEKQIVANIEQVIAANPEASVTINAHKDSGIHALMQTMNAAKSAGINDNSLSVTSYGGN